jgi:glycosyltransferase involved in cell wall biosynthesis
VDNCSSDGSAAIVAKYPWAHFIKLQSNFGFSRGNNLGVWQRLKELKAQGRSADYVCFLNNDTRVEPKWLRAALARFEADSRIGVVGSKACFYDRFVEISFSCSQSFCPSDSGGADSRDLGVFVSARSEFKNVHPIPKRSKWIGAYSVESCGGRWLKPAGRILLAGKDLSSPVDLHFILENRNPRENPLEVTLTVAGQKRTVSIPSGGSEELSISVAPGASELFIQNAGSFVTRTWEGGDVGTFARDAGNFEEPREVSAVCGVSLFMRTTLFQKLRGFDEAYFAYFEDTDLSLRARLAGYSCWYEPQSRLMHVHCGSGGEFSPYFNYNVTHSHTLFTSRWMEGLPFWRRFYWVSRMAWRELKAFAEDKNLETKPNLKTFVQFLRHPLRIPANRLFYLRHMRAIRVLPMEDKVRKPD